MAKRGNPSWVKGVSGNPAGGPKSPYRIELEKALILVAKKKKKGFIQHLVERAFEDDAVAVAISKKILPDMAHITGETNVRHTVMKTITKNGKPLEFNVGD